MHFLQHEYSGNNLGGTITKKQENSIQNLSHICGLYMHELHGLKYGQLHDVFTMMLTCVYHKIDIY